MKDVPISKIALRNNVKWDAMFDSELELIQAMLMCDTTSNRPCKGYVYLDSFKQYYNKNGSLTSRQMIQLKRLAKNIYIHLKTNNNI